MRLPEPGVQHVGIGRVHGQVGRPGGVVAEEHLRPRLAAVLRAEDPALGVRPPHVPLRGHVHEVRIGRMHAHLRDLPRVVEPDVRPRLAAVGGLPHAVAVRHVAADREFTAAHVHHVGIRRGDADRADRAAEVAVAHRRPREPAVGALHDATARRAHPVLARTRDAAGHGDRTPAAIGADLAPADRAERARVEGCRQRGDGPRDGDRRRRRPGGGLDRASARSGRRMGSRPAGARRGEGWFGTRCRDLQDGMDRILRQCRVPVIAASWKTRLRAEGDRVTPAGLAARSGRPETAGSSRAQRAVRGDPVALPSRCGCSTRRHHGAGRGQQDPPPPMRSRARSRQGSARVDQPRLAGVRPVAVPGGPLPAGRPGGFGSSRTGSKAVRDGHRPHAGPTPKALKPAQSTSRKRLSQ